MKVFTETNINKIENLGWSVNKTDEYIEISKHSPLGEELIVYGTTKEEILEYLLYFDIDEHVKMWINSTTSGVPTSISDLVEDAKTIKDMFKNLYDIIMEL